MKTREPLFGGNAKAVVVQLVVALVLAFTVAPIIGRFVADLGCSTIGLCSKEAAARLRVSKPQQ